jgi:hypothetical protein
LKVALGITINLEEYPELNAKILFGAVSKSTNSFGESFFVDLIRCINNGLYANSFHSIQASKSRLHVGRRFLRSQSGESVSSMKFAEAIHVKCDNEDNSDNSFQHPDEVQQALVELFSVDKKKKSEFTIPSELRTYLVENNFDIALKLREFPPSIMACSKLTPFFPPPTEEGYTEYPAQYLDIFKAVLGDAMNEEVGGIGLFDELYSLSPEALVSQYASLISLGQEDLEPEVLESDFYGRFLYLLEALQYFLSIDVEKMVNEALSTES